MIRDMRETYPCCEHCHFPGCPAGYQHQIRCWQCLRLLCATDSESRQQLGDAVTELREFLIAVDKNMGVGPDMTGDVIKPQ
jgi:hypothetical protein